MFKAYLLTGSNMGDSISNLQHARSHISNFIGRITAASSVYKTEPWGNKDQQDFLNQVVEVNTLLSPGEVMSAILGIEQMMGRNRQKKWEPRIIDIDILFFGNLIT